MKRWLWILLLVPVAAADESGDATRGWMDADGGPYDLHGLTWAANADGIVVEWNGPAEGEVRVLVFDGAQGDPEPRSWWLLHVNGTTGRAWQGTETVDARFSFTENVTRAILPGAQGSCTFAIANVHTWDNGLILQDAVPDSEVDLSQGWRQGDLCDGAADVEPVQDDPAVKGKDSPAVFGLPAIGAALILRNWRHASR